MIKPVMSIADLYKLLTLLQGFGQLYPVDIKYVEQCIQDALDEGEKR